MLSTTSVKAHCLGKHHLLTCIAVCRLGWEFCEHALEMLRALAARIHLRKEVEEPVHIYSQAQ